MPKLAPIEYVTNENNLNNETKPGEIIQHIVCAAKRRWSSTLLLESLSSIPSSNDQQTSKPINISVKRYLEKGYRTNPFHCRCVRFSVVRPN